MELGAASVVALAPPEGVPSAVAPAAPELSVRYGFLRRLRVPYRVRHTWHNNDRTQRVVPLRVYAPSSDQLPELVRAAEAAGTTIRAVGSGHSWSDVALGDGFLVRPDHLGGTLDREDSLLLQRDPEAPPLVRFGSGTTIAQINTALAARGLALPNMGGFDGQTIVGAVSTSTHGSGISFGPLSEMVQSLDLVASGGRLFRIEVSDGPTDPAAFAREHPERTLVKNDDWMRSAVVGLGSMGLVESVILAVRPAFHLREVRTMSTWRAVRAQLEKGDVLRNNAHYEILFSPYARSDGEIECLVTTRNEITPAEYARDDNRSRNWLVELAAKIPLTAVVIRVVSNLFPKITPFLLHLSMAGLVKADYVNDSYNVFNIGAANYLPAYSAEIGVPIDDRALHLQAVDEIVKVAARHRDAGNTFQTAPISLRFVRGTEAHLSMMQGHDTMMIELIMQHGSKGGTELLADYEDTLYRTVQGRPHWGQVNHITRERITALYPEAQKWLAVERKLNESGVFASPFTKRVGISA